MAPSHTLLDREIDSIKNMCLFVFFLLLLFLHRKESMNFYSWAGHFKLGSLHLTI